MTAIHEAEHIAVLVVEGHIAATAVATAYGWNIDRGYAHPPTGPKLPRRRAWHSVASRAEAIEALGRVRRT